MDFTDNCSARKSLAKKPRNIADEPLETGDFCQIGVASPGRISY